MPSSSLEGERYAALRLVRASKNRFGSTDEVGVFEMAGEGLVEVSDPARAFLADHAEPAAGSVIAPTMEGSRPLLVEVQALVAPAGLRDAGAQGRVASIRTASGSSSPCSARRAGVALGSHDVYANLAGGLSVGEPGLDLPLALALASSLRDRPLPAKSVAIGEVGLLGELRSVAGLERRLREAARLGFETAIVPRPGAGRRPDRGAGTADRRGRDATRRGRGRPDRGSRASWRRGPGDARLTPRSRPPAGGRRDHPPRKT